jgi:hypothetical protein
LNTPVEKKDLSYEDIPWEKDSNFKAPEKIEEFHNSNKYPPSDIEKKLQKNIKLHKTLLEYA